MSRATPSSNHEFFQAMYPGASQLVSFTNVSGQSAAVAMSCGLVELFATEDCWVVFGSNPTAAANDGDSFFLGAGMFKYYGIQPGHKIAVIRAASDNGDLHIIEGQG